MRLAEPLTGPRWLDPHQAGKITDGSLQRYRKAIQPFAAWLIEMHYNPDQASEWDDLLAEYKHFRGASLTKANFELTVAGVEFLFPRYRGQLKWARAIIAGWGVVHVPRHTTPMCAGPAHLVAVHMSSLGHPRLGAGVLIQQNLGLRPSELLSIQQQDVALPHVAQLGLATNGSIIGLGLRSGTKAKRAQSVILRDAALQGLLSWLVSSARPGETIVPYSYEQYRRILKRVVESGLKVNIAWTPHSPRAGFASDATAAGKSFTEIREAGRWIADSSLRTYVDIVTAASISTSLRLEGLRPAILYARANLYEFFPLARPFLRDGAEAPADQDLARGDGASVAGRVGPETGWLPSSQDADQASEGSDPADQGGHSSSRTRFGRHSASLGGSRRGRGRGRR